MTSDATETNTTDHLAKACERVGRFLYHFALLEQAIEEGVAKLLKLDPVQAKVVMANLDFTRKVNILFSAESEAAAMPDSARKSEIKKTRSAIMSLNQRRVLLAHSPFTYAAGDGVRFDRFTAKGRLLNEGEIWSNSEFESQYEAISETSSAVVRLVSEMEPYSPSLDLNDPRNLVLFAAM